MANQQEEAEERAAKANYERGRGDASREYERLVSQIRLVAALGASNDNTRWRQEYRRLLQMAGIPVKEGR